MSGFIVHSIPGSPYGRSVLATLEEKGAAYRLSPVAPGTFQSEPHISRHPFGKVPVLEHDGFMLFETQAILRYLDRVLPEPGLTPDEDVIAAAMPRAHKVFDILAGLLGDQPYFAGESLSLADLLLAPDIDFFNGLPEWAPLTGHNPNLRAWLDRMNARPSFRDTTWDAVARMALAAA